MNITYKLDDKNDWGDGGDVENAKRIKIIIQPRVKFISYSDSSSLPRFSEGDEFETWDLRFTFVVADDDMKYLVCVSQKN